MSLMVGYAQQVITPSLDRPVYLAGFGRGAEGSKPRKEQQRNQNREETRWHRQHFCIQQPERLQVTDERMEAIK